MPSDTEQTRLVKLKEVARITAGLPARKKMEEDPQGNMRVIRPKDTAAWRRVNHDELIRIRFKGRKIESYFLKPGDILFFGRSGQSHSVVLESPVPENTAAAPSFMVLRIKDDKTLPHYLNWYLNSDRAQKYFMAEAGGSFQRVVTKSVLENLEVPLPEQSDQERIVRIWYLWLKEERLTRQRLKHREEMVQAGIDGILGGGMK